MADFTSWEELLSAVNSAVSDTLKNEVKDSVEVVMQDQINKDVYQAYTPTKYERTGALLDNIEGITTSTDNSSELTVWNDTYQEGVHRGMVYIPEIIEYGHWKSELGYEFPFVGYRKLGEYVYSRPFIEDTFEEVVETGLIGYMLSSGLQKRGIDVG